MSLGPFQAKEDTQLIIFRRVLSPASVRLGQLALTLLIVLYMLLIGGTFAASVLFVAQRLNLVASASLALIWLLVRLVQRRPLKWTGLETAMLLFAASQWLAVLTSVEPRLGLDWAGTVTTWVVFFFILTDVLDSGWPRSYWINALMIAAALVAVNGLWSVSQWFASWVTLRTLPPVTFRDAGLLGQANLTAFVINLLWPIVLAKIIQPGKLVARLAFGALAAGLAMTSFFTSSRAGWLAGAAGLAVLAGLIGYAFGAKRWVSAWRSTWKRWPVRSRLAAIGGMVGLLVAGAWLLSKESQNLTHGSLLASRLEFWSAAWDLFKSRPLSGVGPDLFGWFYSRYASIPPEFFAPHAHSVVLQILSGSGLFGLGALVYLGGAIAFRLWQQWRSNGQQVETACLIAALASFTVHSFFDFLITPVSLLFALTILALALDALPQAAAQRRLQPILATPFVLLPIGIFAFLLIGAGGNANAITVAADGNWKAAAVMFEQTAESDPHLALYWEEAAYAYTRAGDLPAALQLWDRSTRDDPNWALLPAAIGALKQDLASAQVARKMAPGSYLFALNAGAIAEAQGDDADAHWAYRAALQLKPTIAGALFWQQSPVRSSILRDWQNSLPGDNSALAKGWSALRSNLPEQAVVLFQQALAEEPDSVRPYEGLGQSYLQLRDFAGAQRALQAGLALPTASIEETFGLHLLSGEVDEARSDRAGAMAEYAAVFSAVRDYTIDGPGSYGQPLRDWEIYHRESLPSDLVPQLPRADITAEMDQRFAQLAQWYRDQGQPAAACLILSRVQQEAPQSVSGALYPQVCQAT